MGGPTRRRADGRVAVWFLLPPRRPQVAWHFHKRNSAIMITAQPLPKPKPPTHLSTTHPLNDTTHNCTVRWKAGNIRRWKAAIKASEWQKEKFHSCMKGFKCGSQDGLAARMMPGYPATRIPPRLMCLYCVWESVGICSCVCVRVTAFNRVNCAPWADNGNCHKLEHRHWHVACGTRPDAAGGMGCEGHALQRNPNPQSELLAA